MKRRTVALLLSLVMAVCCLSGCTSTRVRSYTEESGNASTDKYAAAVSAYGSNKKVMTVNGSPVYWNEYAYFLCAILANMERYGMQVSDWSAVYDESSQSTYADLMTESIVNNIAWNHLIEVKAAENDVTFDAAGEQFVQDTVDQTIRNVVGDGGTETELNEKLQSYHMDLDLFKYFTKVQYLYNALAEKLFGADGANITDEDVQEYAEANSYTTAKHILLKTIDDSGKASYASVSDPMSSNLTWETVYTYNLGLDLSFLQNRLSFTGDFFIRDTKDMLTQSLTLPSVYGAATPTENCADLRTKGWELSITWRDQFKLGGKPFHYALTGQIGDYQTEITKYNNPTKLFDSYYEGKKLGEIWGYHVPKLFDTDEEAAAYQVAINNSSNVYQRVYNMQNNLGRLMAGDVMFEDRDGSGSIGTGAGTVDDPGDMMIIGNTTPRYSYSFRIEASWNGFDISAFFQGVGKRDWYPTANKDDIYGANQFWQLYGYTIPSFITYDFMDDVWSEQNPGGYFPRLRPIQSYNGGPLGQNNDRYLQSVAYLRFKNLTIGYTLPVLKKYLSKLRIYVSGENLCYWSPLKKHCKLIDPELAISSGTYKGGTGTGYTMPRTFSFGVDITF